MPLLLQMEKMSFKSSNILPCALTDESWGWCFLNVYIPVECQLCTYMYNILLTSILYIFAFNQFIPYVPLKHKLSQVHWHFMWAVQSILGLQTYAIQKRLGSLRILCNIGGCFFIVKIKFRVRWLSVKPMSHLIFIFLILNWAILKALIKLEC